jgi:hypothetical protein
VSCQAWRRPVALDLVINGLVRLLRQMTMPSSHRQRQRSALCLRDLADELETMAPVEMRNDRR